MAHYVAEPAEVFGKKLLDAILNLLVEPRQGNVFNSVIVIMEQTFR